MIPEESVEVFVWTSEDGSVTGLGRMLSAERRARPIARQGQTVTTARVRPDLLTTTGRLRLNRETGELEATD